MPLQTPLLELLQDLESRRIVRQLKSGEAVQFEISHDVLALVVGKNLTTEMKLREDAARLYAMYEKGTGSLSREALDELRFYQQYKPYPAKLAERVRASEQYWAEQDREALEIAQRQAEEERVLREQAEVGERKARQQRRIAVVVSLVAVVLAVFAGWSYLEAQQATEKAEVEKNKAIQSDSLAQVEKKKAEASAIAAMEALQKAQIAEAAKVSAEVDDILGRAIKLKHHPQVYREMVSDCIKILKGYPDNPILQEKLQNLQKQQ